MSTISAATGRRKTATARVSIKEGSGQITINGRSFEEYLPQVSHQNQVLLPLQASASVQKFDITALVSGGGTTGQVGAIRHALARALLNERLMSKPQSALNRAWMERALGHHLAVPPAAV